jgi:hypothetical protein
MSMVPTANRELAVLDALRDAYPVGLCVSEMPSEWAYSARNAVSRLRRLGWEIEGGRCTAHRHKGSVYRYRLQ